MKGKIFVGLVLWLAACLSEDTTISPLKQLKKDIAEIDQYLADHGITNAIKDASGVRIVIKELGTLGLPPGLNNGLETMYALKYLKNDNVVVESNTLDMSLAGYIGGWKIAFPMLPEGTSATLYIPRGWAYGDANLIFDVELLDVYLTDTQNTKLKSDTTAIDAELATFNIDAVKLPGGLRYVITEEGDGTGATPTLYSQVKIGLRGLLLSDSSEFVNQIVMPSVDFSSRVANYPHGVMMGLQKMKEGDKATFFTPSGLAESKYGITIPANSNIVFEIKLLDVIE